MKKIILSAGAIAAALTAIGALYVALKLPLPAWATDIERLDRQQVETAVEVYGNKLRSLILIPPPDDPATQQIWQEEITRARRQLEKAEDKKIELGR